MNNMNFSKNSFINNDPARIANKVVQNNKDGGVVSINQIVSNMQALRRGRVRVKSDFEDGVPVVEKVQRTTVKRSTTNNNGMGEAERMRMQALKNVGKKW